MVDTSAPNFEYVDTASALQEACSYLMQCPLIALDTEFMRVDTFYSQVGLVQLGDGKRTFLVDPLTISEWQPLKDLITAPTVVKLLHASSEDLELLRHWLGVNPAPLADSQIAAAYAGLLLGCRRE